MYSGNGVAAASQPLAVSAGIEILRKGGSAADAAIAMGSATGYYSLWDAFLGKRFEQQISDQIPVTILFGDSDYTLPEASCQERSLTPKHSIWKILPDSGHAPMWDSVNEVVQETLLTIKKVN